MRIWEWLLMCIFTYVGIRYLVDMVKFALGYEINGKKRKPVVDLEKWKKREKAVQPVEQPVVYEWEELFRVS